MYVGPKLSEFLTRAVEVASDADIKDLVGEMGLLLNLPKFALVSHVDLAKETAGVVAITNYHDDWIDRIMSQRYYLDDPLHAASTRRRVGFAWHEVRGIISLTKRQSGILNEAARFGLRDGITVPVHSPGEYRGTCSLGGDYPVIMTSQISAAAHLIATFSFEAARRIAYAHSGQDRPPVPMLSPRHIDCVALIATGLGDAQIAAKLGLSEVTVHQHIREAMRRYRVFKRAALVFRALFDGQICFHKAH